jgi:hypothetical protein
MNAPEEKDPAWELLKKSPPVKASPFFSRNVMREVRKLVTGRTEKGLPWDALLAWFRQPAYAVAAVAVVAGLTAIAVLRSGILQPSPGGTDAPAMAAAQPSGAAIEESTISDADSLEQYDAAEEIENIEYLGQLMAVADPATLTDDALADLFF